MFLTSLNVKQIVAQAILLNDKFTNNSKHPVCLGGPLS
jgi:hypothetical protein